MSTGDGNPVAGAAGPADGSATRITLAVPDDDTERMQLEREWSGKPGFYGWLISADHKSVARRYLVTALVFFALGALEAAAMRAQLARPESALLDPDLYNQFFTMHGSTMMFLFAVPVWSAAAIYLVPLMVGARNIAFPQLNAYGYWVYLIGGLLLYSGFILNTGPDAGWFSYVPLAGPEYSAGKRSDVWAQTVTFTEIAALVAAIQIIATVFKLRTPGMTLNRVPLFVWAMLVTAFMMLFAMPVVASASLMLTFDRLVGTHFFNPAQGGDALLWQHLFWFFGHPEVYIILLPGLGAVSAVIATFARRPVFGYPAMVASLVATGFIGFGLWVHHMFAGPIPQVGQSFFTAASMLIAIPTGVQMFCWIATLWHGRLRLETPLLWVLGFFVVFVVGGLTGVMLASVPMDLQVHDTYFVVAHFHYVLLGGGVFPLMAAVYYWFPKVTGRMLSMRLGRIHFWLFAIGMNVTFLPMHWLGMWGMPRRVYTYLEETGWGDLNLLATGGVLLMILGSAAFVYNVATTLLGGPMAGDDPWGADSLEWATSSPPPPFNFQHPPLILGRSGKWDWGARRPVVTGLRSDRREVLVTSVLDAVPQVRHVLPRDSIWPLVNAAVTGVAFIGGMFTAWAFVVAGAAAAVTITAWFWPTAKHVSDHATRGIA